MNDGPICTKCGWVNPNAPPREIDIRETMLLPAEEMAKIPGMPAAWKSLVTVKPPPIAGKVSARALSAPARLITAGLLRRPKRRPIRKRKVK